MNIDIHTYQVNFYVMCVFMVSINENFESIYFLIIIARLETFEKISVSLNIY